jgi:tape measure domain-containing protein
MARSLIIKTVWKAIDRMSKPMKRMSRRVDRFTKRMKRGLEKVNRVTGMLGRGLLSVGKMAGKMAVGGLLAVGGAAAFAIKQFSKIEDAEAAFTPLLGGARKAAEMVDVLNKTAATTPFQFETLADTAKTLLPVMAGDIARTEKITRQLGDTAGGNAQKLESITRGYTKAMLKGKTDMESLNMIAEAGVPIFTELAASMDMKVGKRFFKQISAGKVSTEDLNGAFEKMTTKGGIFFKGMEIASKTTSGKISTLKDNFMLTAAAIGKVMAPTVKKLIDRLTEVAGKVRKWAEDNKGMLKARFEQFVARVTEVVKGLSKAIGGFLKDGKALDTVFDVLKGIGKAFMFLWDNRKVILTLGAIIGGLIVTLKIFVAVLTVVNLVMAANPVTLIVLGVVALVAIIVALMIKFKVFQRLMAWWKEISPKIAEAFKGLGEFLVGFWDEMRAVFWGGINWIVTTAKDLWTGFVDGIKEIFGGIPEIVTGIWDKAVDAVRNAIDRMKNFVRPAFDFLKKLVGMENEVQKKAPQIRVIDGGRKDAPFGGGPAAGSSRPQVVTDGDRVSRIVSEKFETSSAEVTLKDETGRAEVTKGKLAGGVKLRKTGTF